MTVKALHRQVRDRINAYNLMSYIISFHVNLDWNNFCRNIKPNFILVIFISLVTSKLSTGY